MSVDWFGIYKDCGDVRKIGDVEGFLVGKGVEKSKVMDVVRSSLGSYGYNRNYRNERGSNMSELKKENERLKKELESVSK